MDFTRAEAVQRLDNQPSRESSEFFSNVKTFLSVRTSDTYHRNLQVKHLYHMSALNCIISFCQKAYQALNGSLSGRKSAFEGTKWPPTLYECSWPNIYSVNQWYCTGQRYLIVGYNYNGGTCAEEHCACEGSAAQVLEARKPVQFPPAHTMSTAETLLLVEKHHPFVGCERDAWRLKKSMESLVGVKASQLLEQSIG